MYPRLIDRLVLDRTVLQMLADAYSIQVRNRTRLIPYNRLQANMGRGKKVDFEGPSTETGYLFLRKIGRTPETSDPHRRLVAYGLRCCYLDYTMTQAHPSLMEMPRVSLRLQRSDNYHDIHIRGGRFLLTMQPIIWR